MIAGLFEECVPAAERVKRLGTVVDLSSILTIAGDASRGRRIFHGPTSKHCGDGSPSWRHSFLSAGQFDQWPHEGTRAAAVDPWTGLLSEGWAGNVDVRPRDATHEAF